MEPPFKRPRLSGPVEPDPPLDYSTLSNYDLSGDDDPELDNSGEYNAQEHEGDYDEDEVEEEEEGGGDADMDLQQKRMQLDGKLKSEFEAIFEKYGQDFTGIGDEIDLMTGEIVVDNGHLQEMQDEKDAGTKSRRLLRAVTREPEAGLGFGSEDDEQSEDASDQGVDPEDMEEDDMILFQSAFPADSHRTPPPRSPILGNNLAPRQKDSRTSQTNRPPLPTEGDLLSQFGQELGSKIAKYVSEQQVLDDSAIEPAWQTPGLPLVTPGKRPILKSILLQPQSDRSPSPGGSTSVWAEPAPRGRPRKKRTNTAAVFTGETIIRDTTWDSHGNVSSTITKQRTKHVRPAHPMTGPSNENIDSGSIRRNAGRKSRASASKTETPHDFIESPDPILGYESEEALPLKPHTSPSSSEVRQKTGRPTILRSKDKVPRRVTSGRGLTVAQGRRPKLSTKRVNFTEKEDEAIIEWVKWVEKQGYSVWGRSHWQAFAQKNPQHSARSWHNHCRYTLMEKGILKCLVRHDFEANGTMPKRRMFIPPPQHVIPKVDPRDPRETSMAASVVGDESTNRAQETEGVPQLEDTEDTAYRPRRQRLPIKQNAKSRRSERSRKPSKKDSEKISWEDAFEELEDVEPVLRADSVRDTTKLQGSECPPPASLPPKFPRKKRERHVIANKQKPITPPTKDCPTDLDWQSHWQNPTQFSFEDDPSFMPERTFQDRELLDPESNDEVTTAGFTGIGNGIPIDPRLLDPRLMESPPPPPVSHSANQQTSLNNSAESEYEDRLGNLGNYQRSIADSTYSVPDEELSSKSSVPEDGNPGMTRLGLLRLGDCGDDDPDFSLFDEDDNVDMEAWHSQNWLNDSPEVAVSEESSSDPKVVVNLSSNPLRIAELRVGSFIPDDTLGKVVIDLPTEKVAHLSQQPPSAANVTPPILLHKEQTAAIASVEVENAMEISNNQIVPLSAELESEVSTFINVPTEDEAPKKPSLGIADPYYNGHGEGSGNMLNDSGVLKPSNIPEEISERPSAMSAQSTSTSYSEQAEGLGRSNRQLPTKQKENMNPTQLTLRSTPDPSYLFSDDEDDEDTWKPLRKPRMDIPPQEKPKAPHNTQPQLTQSSRLSSPLVELRRDSPRQNSRSPARTVKMRSLTPLSAGGSRLRTRLTKVPRSQMEVITIEDDSDDFDELSMGVDGVTSSQRRVRATPSKNSLSRLLDE